MKDITSSGQNGAGGHFFYGYVIVAVAFVIMMVTHGLHYTFGIYFTPLLEEFGWSRATTSGAFSLAWISNGILAIVIGCLCDKLGPRLIVTFCGLLAGAGYILMSHTSHLWHVYVFYGVLVGASISVYIPLVSTVARWFTRRRTLMTGLFVTGTGIGSLAGPPLANWLISCYDWRTSYTILGLVVMILTVSTAQFLRRSPAEGSQSLRSVEQVQTYAHTAPDISFGLKRAIRTPQFWTIFFLVFCNGFCFSSGQVHTAPYTTDLGLSARTAAQILATIGAASITGRVLLGFIGDSSDNRKASILGFILMAMALVMFLFADQALHLYIFAALFGLAYGGLIAQESPLVASIFGLSSHGLTLGVVLSGFKIGAALGPLVAGYLFDVQGSYRLAFTICAILAVAGIVGSLLLSPLARQGSKKDIQLIQEQTTS